MPLYQPAPGLKIRAKSGHLIPSEGIEIDPHDAYYRRHIQDGSLLAMPAPPSAKVKTPKEAE